MDLQTNKFRLWIEPQFAPDLFLAVILLVFGAFFYIRWRENLGIWMKVFDIRKPSLESAPSAFDTTVVGIGALLAAGIYLALTIASFVFGIDQLLFSGRFWSFIDSLLRSEFLWWRI